MNIRYNIDGLLAAGDNSYSTLYRCGILETASAQLLAKDVIPSTALAVSLANAVQRYMKLAAILEIAPPVFVFAMLVGAKGLKFAVGTEFGVGYYERGAIDRDQVFLPDVVIEDLNGNVEDIIRPLLDGLWQAAGLDGWSK